MKANSSYEFLGIPSWLASRPPGWQAGCLAGKVAHQRRGPGGLRRSWRLYRPSPECGRGRASADSTGRSGCRCSRLPVAQGRSVEGRWAPPPRGCPLGPPLPAGSRWPAERAKLASLARQPAPWPLGFLMISKDFLGFYEDFSRIVLGFYQENKTS